MSNTQLRKSIIRLAHMKPELRKDLLPLLVKEAMEHDSPEALKKYLKDHPKADKNRHTVKKQEKRERGDSKATAEKLIKDVAKLEKDIGGRMDSINKDMDWPDVGSKGILGAPGMLKSLEKSMKNLKDIQNAGKKLDSKDFARAKKMVDHHDALTSLVKNHASKSKAWEKSVESLTDKPEKKPKKLPKPNGNSGLLDKIKGIFRKKKASGYNGNFRSFVIRLAHDNPKLRKNLLPLVID